VPEVGVETYRIDDAGEDAGAEIRDGINALIRLGRIQAANFSWSRCAQETAAVYEAAAA